MGFAKILFFIFFIFPQLGLCKAINLPEMVTKQNINNLRFISNDGKYTYFQTNQGELLLSTNYETKQVLKKEAQTIYLVFASSERKKMVVQSSPLYFTANNFKQDQDLTVVDFGTHKTSSLGSGISPRLHFQDAWVSFYHAAEKKLEFQNLNQSSFKFQVSLQNPINPFFVPEVVMLDPNTILFTDLNKDGVYAVIKYTRASNKSEVVFKADSPGVKIELCLQDDTLIMGQFPLANIKAQSSISRLKLNGPIANFNELENLYTSTFPDAGNLIFLPAEKKVYFIKASKAWTSLAQYPLDLAELDLSSKTVRLVTTFGFISQAVNMDGQVFVPYNGKYYIAVGEDTLKADQLKKVDTDEVIKKINEEIK